MAKKWKQEDFIREFYKRNPSAKDIEILSPYISNKKKMICRCKIDGIIWFTTPNLLLRPHGCPTCGCQKKYNEQFLKEMKDKNPNIKILSNYIDAKTKVICKCLIDNFIWDVRPNDLLNGHGCPKCGNYSKGEYIISDILSNNKIKNINQYWFDDCRCKNPLPFDFYLPKYNICIEYDGIQHYKLGHFNMGLLDLMNVQYKDNIKTNYCQQNNIKLIRIPYWNYDNIEEILIRELNL